MLIPCFSDWGPGEWNDGLEWPAGGRGASRAGRGGPDSKRPLKRGELKGGRAGDKDLEEVLSDISDDADEILNRDEEALDSDSTVSGELLLLSFRVRCDINNYNKANYELFENPGFSNLILKIGRHS